MQETAQNDKHIGRLRHITAHATSQTLPNLLRNHFKESDSSNVAPEAQADSSREAAEFLITGLHSCGDLTANMLRLFVSTPSAKAVCVVGCCYNFITETDDLDDDCDDDEPINEPAGFPLSRFVKNMNPHLGIKARQLACQVPARWESKFTETKEAFRRHYYRASLQVKFCERKEIP